ncbi:hypothetical protein BT69DRAFT_1348001 [Atractiella rhizophila]|nr:hypothetical protein BT69DRAFT_1348001 [Atractiella rhizophila]
MSAAPAPPKKAPVLRSCRQCRTKRQKCSRGEPCEQCVARGEGDQCDWQGAKPLPKHILRGKNDLEELRDKLNRLEKYIESQQIGNSSSSPTAVLQRKSSTNFGSPPSVPVIETPVENLVSAFTRLALPDSIRPLQHQGGMDDEKLIKEAKNELTSYAFIAPQLSTTPSHGFTFHQDRRTLHDIIHLVPSPTQIDVLLLPFYTYQDIAYHPFHIPTLKKKIKAFREDPKSVHPHFLASLLSVLAMTLLPFHRHGPQTEEWEKAMKKAKELASAAVRLLEIEQQPTFEGVRAHILTGRFFWVLPGDDVLFCRSMYAKAVFWANELSMNFDPDDLNVQFTLVEKEERRRIAFVLAQIEFMNCSLHGKIWTPLDSGAWSVNLPSELSDDEIEALSNERKDLKDLSGKEEEGRVPQLSKRVLNFFHQCALILRRIDTKILGQRQISYLKVVDLGKELEALEKTMPASYRYNFDCDDDLASQLAGGGPSFQVYRGYVNSAIAFCYIKLYQPFFSVAADEVKDVNDYRQLCIDHARHITIMQRSPIFRRAGLAIQFYGVSAAVVLAIACLRYPNHKNFDESLRYVKSACECLEPFMEMSPTMRRSVAILEFILRKVGQNDDIALRRTTKRTKRSPGDDNEYSPIYVPGSGPANSDSPEEERLVHKAPAMAPSPSTNSTGSIPSASYRFPADDLASISAQARPVALRNDVPDAPQPSYQFTFQPPYHPPPHQTRSADFQPSSYFDSTQQHQWPIATATAATVARTVPPPIEARYYPSAPVVPSSAHPQPPPSTAPQDTRIPNNPLFSTDFLFNDVTLPYPNPSPGHANVLYAPPSHPPPDHVPAHSHSHQYYDPQTGFAGDQSGFSDHHGYDALFNRILEVFPRNANPS